MISNRDKLAQIEAQLRQAEMESYLHGTKLSFLEGYEKPADEAPDHEKQTYNILDGEVSASRSLKPAWDRKVSVLQAEHDRLKKLIDAEPKAEAKAAKP